jgi:hypothetical protein
MKHFILLVRNQDGKIQRYRVGAISDVAIIKYMKAKYPHLQVLSLTRVNKPEGLK